MWWKKTLVITMCLMMAVVAPVQAQQIPNVFDQIFQTLQSILGLGGNKATESTQLWNHGELVAQLGQLVKVYTQAKQTFDLAAQQAQHLVSANTYKSVWRQWLQALAKDTYGHNVGFISDINGELGAINGSLRRLPDLSGVLGKLHMNTIDRVSWQYSLAELDDGVAQYAADTAGDVHANDQQASLARLDDVVFTDADGLNTAVQQAEKTALATAIAAHQNEDIKRLLAVISAQQTLDIKTKRDLLEQAMTEYQEWLDRAQSGEVQTYIGNPSDRISNFTYGN